MEQNQPEKNDKSKLGYGSSFQMKSYRKSVFEKCEKLGEDAVRKNSVHWSARKRKFSDEWLSLREFKTKSARNERADEREEENLSISRKALTNSDRATRIAISAIVLSIIVAISKIIDNP